MVIVVHGGPESHFSDGWNTTYSRWSQLLANRGYFAWLPNYRASTGRGVAFAKANHGDPMGGEFHDHLRRGKGKSLYELVQSAGWGQLAPTKSFARWLFTEITDRYFSLNALGLGTVEEDPVRGRS